MMQAHCILHPHFPDLHEFFETYEQVFEEGRVLLLKMVLHGDDYRNNVLHCVLLDNLKEQ